MWHFLVELLLQTYIIYDALSIPPVIFWHNHSSEKKKVSKMAYLKGISDFKKTALNTKNMPILKSPKRRNLDFVDKNKLTIKRKYHNKVKSSDYKWNNQNISHSALLDNIFPHDNAKAKPERPNLSIAAKSPVSTAINYAKYWGNSWFINGIFWSNIDSLTPFPVPKDSKDGLRQVAFSKRSNLSRNINTNNSKSQILTN